MICFKYSLGAEGCRVVQIERDKLSEAILNVHKGIDLNMSCIGCL